MSRFTQQNAMPADEGVQVKATVKWFNLSKGFGFVAPADGTPDAFLHISVVNRAGLNFLQDGTEMLCFIGAGPKGPQVTRIVEITGINESAAAGSNDSQGFRDRPFRAPRSFDRPQRQNDFESRPRFEKNDQPFSSQFQPASGPETEVTGTVKWFKADKGFGFAAADDSNKDVFIHKSVLRRAGLIALEPGQRIHMKVQEASKGREATWVAPATE